jgi:uncharacterized RDD family membrane protein YckC
MFCPKCGKETDASGKFCQWCGADIASIPANPVVTPEEEEVPDIGVYAGLGRRFVAFIVDIIIILLFDLVAMAVLGLTRGIQNSYYYFVQHVPVDQLTTDGTLAAFLGTVIAAYGVVLIVIPWLYFAGFESSRSQATRVTLRHFAKFVSALIILIGFLMIGLTQKRQGLHDKIAGCLVLLQD